MPKPKRFPGAKTAGKRFFLRKMSFSGVKSAPCPRCAFASPKSAMPTVIPRRISWIRRPWPLQFMAANGRREDARQQAAVGPADRQRRYEFFGEFRKTEDLGRSNLWRPMVVNRIRGSNRNRALPGGGLGDQSAGPTATCCRAFYRQAMCYSRASPSRDTSRQRRPVISRKLLEIRRIWELQSMVPEFVA